MLYLRRSDLDGKYYFQNLDIAPEAMVHWLNTPINERPLIQEAFPQLSADDREFILTGTTGAAWEAMFNEKFS